MSNASDFVIEDGVLKKYVGPGGDVVVPEGVYVLGDYCFVVPYDPEGNALPITSISLPNNLTSIGAGAFTTCALTEIALPDSVNSIGNEAFMVCKSLKHIKIPKGVAAIGSEMFRGCRELSSVILPDTVKSIGNNAFDHCESLVEINMPTELETIGNSAFYGCGKLSSVTVSESLKTIGSNAFTGCKGLVDDKGFVIINGILMDYYGSSADVSIPYGVTRIDSLSFQRCHTLNYVNIPDSVTSIERYTFAAPGKKRSLILEIKQWIPDLLDVLSDCDAKAIVAEDYTLFPPKYRKAMAIGFAFRQNNDLSTEETKAFMEYLSKNAAKLCADAFDMPELLRFLCEQRLIKAKDIDVYLEEARKRKTPELKALLLNYQNEIGQRAVSKAREKKEKKAEDYTDRLVKRVATRKKEDGISGLCFVITGSLNWWKTREELKAYLEGYGAKLGTGVTAKTDYLVTNEKQSKTEKKQKAKELGVPIIDEQQFNYLVGRLYRDAEHIDIPSWVKMIPESAFSEASSVKSVTIPDSVTSIGDNAFAYCEKLTDIVIPESVTRIGTSAFQYCKGLANTEGFVIVKGILFDYYGTKTEITIPEGVREISGFVYYQVGPKKVTKTIFPSSLEKIGTRAFDSCALEEVVLPDGVKEIGEYAFAFSSSLANVKLSRSLKTIGHYAFGDCKNLKKVVVFNGLEEIGSVAFMGCKALTELHLPDSVKHIGENTFLKCPKLTIHAPSGSYAEQYAKENNIPFEAE